MNIIDKKQNEKIISNMNKRINYMRNPRYKIIRPPILFSHALTKPVSSFIIIFSPMQPDSAKMLLNKK